MDIPFLIIGIVLLILWYVGVSWWIATKAKQSGMNVGLWVALHVFLPLWGLVIFLIVRKYSDPLKRDIARLKG